MKNLLITAAIAGLLIGGPAMAQNSDQTQAPAATTTQSGTNAASSRDGVRTRTTIRQGGERTTMERSTMRTRNGDRTSVRVRMGGDRYGYRHRAHRGYVAFAHGCRTVIVKKHFHGRTVIKRIRRCA